MSDTPEANDNNRNFEDLWDQKASIEVLRDMMEIARNIYREDPLDHGRFSELLDNMLNAMPKQGAVSFRTFIKLLIKESDAQEVAHSNIHHLPHQSDEPTVHVSAMSLAETLFRAAIGEHVTIRHLSR